MGEASRRQELKPKKIRERSLQEIAAVIVAYGRLYEYNPFMANMMLLCSELSEYIPVPPLDDEDKMRAFLKENMDGLAWQFVRRFKSADQYAIPAPPSPLIQLPAGHSEQEDRWNSQL